MPSKIIKQNIVSAKGVLSIENGLIFVEISDTGRQFSLAGLLREFEGLEINFVAEHKEEIGGVEY